MLTWERLLQNCLKAPRQLINLVLSSSGVSINMLLQIRILVICNMFLKGSTLKIADIVDNYNESHAQINCHYTHPGKASSITSVFCKRKTLGFNAWWFMTTDTLTSNENRSIKRRHFQWKVTLDHTSGLSSLIFSLESDLYQMLQKMGDVPLYPLMPFDKYTVTFPEGLGERSFPLPTSGWFMYWSRRVYIFIHFLFFLG